MRNPNPPFKQISYELYNAEARELVSINPIDDGMHQGLSIQVLQSDKCHEIHIKQYTHCVYTYNLYIGSTDEKMLERDDIPCSILFRFDVDRSEGYIDNGRVISIRPLSTNQQSQEEPQEEFIPR